MVDPKQRPAKPREDEQAKTRSQHRSDSNGSPTDSARSSDPSSRTTDKLPWSISEFIDLLGSHPDEIIWVVAYPSGEVLHVSPSFETVWGISRVDLMAKPRLWYDNILPEERVAVETAFGDFLAGHSDFKRVYKIRRPDGHIRVVEDRSLNIKQVGDVTYAMGRARDITEAYQLNEELNEKQADLAAAQELSGVGRWTVDLNTGLVDSIDMPGGEAKVRVSGMTFPDSLATVEPEERERVLEAYRALVEDGKPYNVVFSYYDQDQDRTRTMHSMARVDREKNRVLGTALDITDIVQNKSDLEESQRLIDILTTHATDFIVLLRERQMIYCNDAVLTQLRGDRDRLHDEDGYLEFVAPEERDRIGSFNTRRQQGDEALPSAYETVLLGSDGERIPAEVRAHRVTYKGLSAVLAILRNVSDRAQAEDNMRLAEDIIQSTPVGMHIYAALGDDQLKLIGVNPEGERILGVPADTLVGKTIDDAFPGLREAGVVDEYLKVLHTGEIYSLPSIHYESGSIEGWYHVRAYRVGEDRLVVSFSDISDQVQAEADMRLAQDITESIPVGLHIHEMKEDGRLIIISANPESERITGIPSSELIGKSVEEAFPGLRESGIIDEGIQVLEEGGVFHLEAFRAQTPDFNGWFNIRVFKAGERRLAMAFSDVTEQEEARLALKESEELLRLFLDSSMDGITIWDKDQRLVLINRAAENVLPVGMTREEALGKSHQELTGQDYERIVQRAIKRGSAQRGKVRFATERGGDRIYDTRAFPVGEGVGIMGLDVTEARRQEMALQKSEERLRQFMDSADESFTLWDSDLRLVDANTKAQSYLPHGMTLEDIRGTEFEEFGKPALCEEAREVLRTGQSYSDRVEHHYPNIGTRIVDMRLFKVGDGLGVISSDVTETEQARRELVISEQRNRAFLSSVTDAIYLLELSDDGKPMTFSEVNDGACRMTGYSSEEFSQMTLLEINHPTLKVDDRLVVKKLIEGESVRFEQVHITKAGDPLYVDVSATTLELEGKRYIFAVVRDISEQKHDKEQLRQSEQRFRTLFGSLTDAVFVHRPTQKNTRQNFLEVNNVASQMTGYDRDELLTKTIGDLEHPTEGIQTRAIAERVSRGERVTFEQVLRTKSGEVLPVEITSTLGRLDDEEVVFSIARDIRERKAAEQELRRSEQKFRMIFDSMADAVILHTLVEPVKDARFLVVNDVACRRYGYTRQQMIEMTIGDISPKDEIDAVVSPESTQRLLDGEWVQFETVHVTRTGHLIPVEIRSAFVEYDGAPAIISVVQDVTHKRQAEEKLSRSYTELRLAQRIASIGSWSIDPATRQVEWSEEMFRIYGWDIADGTPTLEQYRTLHTRKSWMELKAVMSKAFSKGVPFDTELQLRTKDGQSKYIRAIAEPEPERGPKGHILRGTIQDITSVRIVERELEANFNISLAMLCVADLTTATFTRVNPAWTNILGHSPEVLTSQPFTNFVHPDDVEPTQRVTEEQLRSGKRVISFENRYRCADGSYRWLVWNSTPDLENNQVYAVAVDITDRRRAEESLRARVEFERLLLNLSTHFINLPPDQVNSEIHSALQQIGEFEGVDRSYVFTFNEDLTQMSNTHEWCAPGVEPVSSMLQNLDTTEFVWFMSKIRNNQTVMVNDVDNVPESAVYEQGVWREQDIQSLVCVPMTVQGKLIGFLGLDSCKIKRSWPDEEVAVLQLVGDILASAISRGKTESEIRRLALAIEQIAETIVITDRDGDIVYVNKAFEESSGYCRDEAIGKNPRILQSGKQDRDFYVEMWSALTRGEVWRGMITNRRKDGTLYHETVVISPMHNEFGETEYYVAAKQDITKQLKLEEQLRQAHKMEAVGNLAGGIAHDFNNMLTVITGNVDLLLLAMKDQPLLRQEIEEIGQTAERAANLTRQLLSFSRKQVLRPKNVKLNEVVRSSERLLRRAVREDIDVTLTLSKESWTVRIDPVQLDQILINLVVNARDAMPDGGKIVIRTRNLRAEQVSQLDESDMPLADHVCLEVIDSGTGMDEATLTHIFEPFFTTKDTGKGTGLGLATVYGIAKQSGGTLQVSSQIDKGSTFSIYLPRVISEEDHTSKVPAQKSALHGDERILVVEDDAMVRRSAVRALELHGYHVSQAANARAALELIEGGFKPALVVTDVVMPGMSGGDMVKELQKMGNPAKVIFMSGYPADAAATEGLLKGANYIQKPFRMLDFVGRIREVLDGGKI